MYLSIDWKLSRHAVKLNLLDIVTAFKQAITLSLRSQRFKPLDHMPPFFRCPSNVEFSPTNRVRR